MASTAGILGKDDDVARYAAMAADRRDFFKRTYVDDGKVRYRFVVPESTVAALTLPGSEKQVMLKPGEHKF